MFIVKLIIFVILPLCIPFVYYLVSIGYKASEMVPIFIASIALEVILLFIWYKQGEYGLERYIIAIVVIFIIAGWASHQFKEPLNRIWSKIWEHDQKIEDLKSHNKLTDERLAFMEEQIQKFPSISTGSEIENVYKNSIPKPSNPEEAFKQHVEADYEFRNKNFETARKIYLNLLSNYAKSEELKSVLNNSIGATFANAGNRNEALIWYNKAREFKNHTPNVDENIAATHFWLGNYQKAVEEYKLIQAKSPSDFSINNKLGVVYSLDGAYNEAIKQFKTSIENGFIVRGLYFNIALNYLHKGPEFDADAIVYLEKELELYPDNTAAMFQLGATYCWQGQCGEKGAKLIEDAVLKDNQLLRDFPKFGLQNVLESLPPLETITIDSVKIFPDLRVVIEYSENT